MIRATALSCIGDHSHAGQCLSHPRESQCQAREPCGVDANGWNRSRPHADPPNGHIPQSGHWHAEIRDTGRIRERVDRTSPSFVARADQRAGNR
jgi:hypothetical protein